MTPDQITQLRQLLREAQEAVGSLTPAGICYPLYGEKEIQTTLAKALALLPCPTCNDSQQIGDEIIYQGRSMGWKECLDCQKHSP